MTNRTFDRASLLDAQGFTIPDDGLFDRAGWSVAAAGRIRATNANAPPVITFAGPAPTLDLTGLAAAQGFIIQGDVADDRAGFSVSDAGDINGDGFDDLIVGARGSDNGGSYAGEAYVIFGRAGATRTNIDLTSLAASDGFVIQGDTTYDYAGHSVSAAGDINGDGIDDLIVGAPGGGNGGLFAGEAYVIFGRVGATRTDIDLTSLAASDGFTIQGDAALDQAGGSIAAAGDINGDGFDDMIVGARLGDNGGYNAGEAYVIFGKAGGTRTNIDLTSLAASDGFIIQGDAADDQFGWSVSDAADINGDGIDDLIIGATRGDDGGTSAGEAYVIFGKAGATRTNIDVTSLAASDGLIIQGDRAGDEAGISVSAAGDINGDGIGDLIVGASQGDDGGNDAGEAYVIFGKAGGTRTNIDLTSLAASDGFIIQGDVNYDGAGRSVSSAGDINGDGFDDLIVGAPNGDNGGSNAGEAYVIFGKAGGTRANIDLTSLAAGDGFVIQGDAAGDRAGVSVSAAGDINGDSFDDLIVGAPYGDNGGSNAGEAYVIYGRASFGAATVSFAENGTGTAYQIVASDADAGTTLTYSLTGTDAALFNVSASGAVTFKTAPNFEAAADAGANNVYDLIVNASDGTATTSQALAITVTDVAGENVAPVITSAATASFAENGTGTAYQIVASDPDAGTTLTYSLTGTDAALFNVSASGAVAFATAPNFEAAADAGANNVYDIIVNASDGTLTASQGLTITVTDVVENVAPVITSAATASFAENATGTAYQIIASDADAGTTLTYSLTGADAALFNVSASGAVTFATAPNFEAATDTGADNVYDLIVNASDGTLTASRAVAISVTNVNEAPIIIVADAGPGAAPTLDLTGLTAAQGFIIQGDVADDRAGFSVSDAGDINGDGLDDMIVGAPGGDDGGTDAGEAYVIFGRAGGTRTNIDLTSLAASDGFIIQGDAAGDRAGRSVSAAGDINNDGFGDLIVGAPQGDIGGAQASEAYVIFGKAGGTRTDIDLTSLAASDGFTIQGDRANDQFGWSVSTAGDINGDGFDDMIVGARLGDNGGYNAGEAYVIFGKAGGTRTDIDLTSLAASDGFIVQGDAAGDEASYSVSAAGDINGDGYGDLIVGARGGDNGGTDAGEAYVIFGQAGATRTNIDLTSLAVSAGFIIQGDVAGDNAGRSVSTAGDINGDGFDDLIVGATNGDNGGSNAGEAYVIFGKAGGTRTDIDLTSLAASDGFIIQGDRANDYAGFSVSAAGDINGDGFDDMIVGAYGGDNGGGNAGEAYVIFGKAGSSRTNIDLTSLAASDGFIIQGDAAGDRAGGSVSAAGDINNDGFDDLIVGAPFGSNGGTNAGEAYVIYGRASFGPATANFVENGTGTAYQIIASDADAGTTLTYSLTGADAALFDVSASGSVTFKTAPNFEAAADAGANNVYDLIVNASDGTATTSQALAITVTDTNVGEVQTRVFTGTFGADSFTVGDADGWTISGLGGVDTLTGGENADVIIGGKSNDMLAGGGNNDDFLVGLGDGIDSFDGGAGFDRIRATAANALIGISSLSGIEAIDSGGLSGVAIVGTSLADVLDFSGVTLSGIEYIDALGGNDDVTGSAGNDTFLLGAGNDSFDGGEGDDIFIARLLNGNDTVEGGAGTDVIVAGEANTRIQLAAFNGIEEISAGGFAGVTIVGTSLADVLDFSGVTLSGIEYIDALGGNDDVTGSAGNDIFLLGAGSDSFDGGDGNDIFIVRPLNGIDIVEGGAGTDVIVAGEANTRIQLAAFNGIEEISAGGFAGVTIVGSAAAETLDFTGVTLTGIAAINGAGGRDVITGSAGADTIIGGSGGDTLTGGGGADVFAYLAVLDSPRGLNADVITDFVSGQDVIDLSGVDAIGDIAGNQAFTFIGTDAFTGLGQLRVAVDGNGNTALFGNISGNLTADFQISLLGAPVILPTDVLL